MPDELKFEGSLEEVSKEVGEKESTMANAEVLSDGAVKDSVQVEMDKLDADEETDRMCTLPTRKAHESKICFFACTSPFSVSLGRHKKQSTKQTKTRVTTQPC